MCGFPLQADLGDESLAAGLAFHQTTDSVFHSTEMFTKANRRLLLEMKEKGVRRGPARAAAHIGVEMLIDAELCRNEAHITCYLQSLDWAMSTKRATAALSLLQRTALRRLCRHLRSEAASIFTPTSERFALRLGRTLGHRARLAPTPLELEQIALLCAAAAPPVMASVPQLLLELTPLLVT